MSYRGLGFGKIIKGSETIWFNSKFIVKKNIDDQVENFGSLNDYKNIKKGDRWEFDIVIPWITTTENYSLSLLNDGEPIIFYEHADKDFSYTYYAYYFYNELENKGYLSLTAIPLDKPANYSIPVPIAYTDPISVVNKVGLNGLAKTVINGYDFSAKATQVNISIRPIIKKEAEQKSGLLKRVYKISEGQIDVKGSLRLRIWRPTETEYINLASVDGTTIPITLTEDGNIYNCFMNIHDNYKVIFDRGYIDLELPILSVAFSMIITTPVITQDAGAMTIEQDQGAEIHYTTDGSTPIISSPIYLVKLTNLTVGAEVKANATMNGKWSFITTAIVEFPKSAGGTLRMEEIQIPLEPQIGGTLRMEEIIL